METQLTLAGSRESVSPTSNTFQSSIPQSDTRNKSFVSLGTCEVDVILLADIQERMAILLGLLWTAACNTNIKTLLNSCHSFLIPQSLHFALFTATRFHTSTLIRHVFPEHQRPYTTTAHRH